MFFSNKYYMLHEDSKMDGTSQIKFRSRTLIHKLVQIFSSSLLKEEYKQNLKSWEIINIVVFFDAQLEMPSEKVGFEFSIFPISSAC